MLDLYSFLYLNSSHGTAQNLSAVPEPSVRHLQSGPLFNLYMAGPKCSWNLCIICIKKDIYKT